MESEGESSSRSVFPVDPVRYGEPALPILYFLPDHRHHIAPSGAGLICPPTVWLASRLRVDVTAGADPDDDRAYLAQSPASREP